MKNWTLLLSTLFLGLQAAVAFAYKPLVGTEWARAGQLPFSECYLSNRVADEAGVRPWFGGDYVMGWNIDEFEEYNFISCQSDDEGIAFSIPVRLSKAITFPSLPIYKLSGSRYTFSDNIEGKSLYELFGTFMGIRIALPFPGGIGGYWNSTGVSLTVQERAFGVHAKAGISGFSLTPVPSKLQINIHKKYKSNPFVITARKLVAPKARDFPLFLSTDKKGKISLKAKSGALLFIGNKNSGCKLSKHELKVNQGLDQATLMTLNKNDCSIIVKFSDGSLVLQKHNGINTVLSDSAIEGILGSMKFVRSSKIK